MNQNYNAILLHHKDNVATALEEIPKGARINLSENEIQVELIEEVRFGHKFSLQDIHKSEEIYKYGVAIGKATKNIKKGEHVHLHNMKSMQREGDENEGLQEGGWKNRNT